MLHLFSQYSFLDIGMQDVAEEAEIFPASIYRYFSSRDDILTEILSEEISKGRQKQWKRVESGATSLEDITARIVDFFWERESTLQIVGNFMWNYDVDEEAKKKFRGFQKSYLDEFDRVLRGWVVKGDNVRLFSKTFFASLFGIIASYRNNHQGADTENAYNISTSWPRPRRPSSRTECRTWTRKPSGPRRSFRQLPLLRLSSL